MNDEFCKFFILNSNLCGSLQFKRFIKIHWIYFPFWNLIKPYISKLNMYTYINLTMSTYVYGGKRIDGILQSWRIYMFTLIWFSLSLLLWAVCHSIHGLPVACCYKSSNTKILTANSFIIAYQATSNKCISRLKSFLQRKNGNQFNIVNHNCIHVC